jgi:uncharacterized protein YyaL (SSP411 family)
MEREVKELPVTFVCKGFTCLPPVKNQEDLKKVLV